MTVARVYLDHNASAPLRPEAKAAMLEALAVTGNASSVHREGRAARERVEAAREQVAALVGAKAAEVVFTSGATEANCAVIAGGGWSHIAVGATEHDSVLAPAYGQPATVRAIPVDHAGCCDLDAITAWARDTEGTDRPRLLAAQWANNETGVIQPVARLAALAAEAGVRFHCDGVQAAGREAVHFAALEGLTSLSLSAHKLGGPQGVGALVLRDGAKLQPLIVGGGQERRRRAGTENVAAIAGFGAAAEAARAGLAQMDAITELRDTALAAMARLTPDLVVFGAAAPRLGNTACVAVPGHSAETLLIKLDLAGVAVSSGAACSSGKVGPSHVLASMAVDDSVAKCAIRVSFGWNSSKADLEAFLSAWAIVAGSDAARSRAG